VLRRTTFGPGTKVRRCAFDQDDLRAGRAHRRGFLGFRKGRLRARLAHWIEITFNSNNSRPKHESLLKVRRK
jgi:hypothetical protein